MITVDDFVMLGRTEPQQTKKNGITVCSIGYSKTLRSLIRVYPIPLGLSVPKFSVCSVKLIRGNDSRPESFKLPDLKNSLIVGEKLSQKKKKELLEDLKSFRASSINELNEQRRSTGILIPQQIDGKWKPRKDLSESERQLEIEGMPKDNPLFSMPEIPLLSIVNEDGSFNNLQLRDWGCSEFIRRYVITGRYHKNEIWNALHFDKPQMLLVGNMRHFPISWLAVCTFTMKSGSQSRFLQTSLF